MSADTTKFFVTRPPRPMLSRDADSVYWMSRYVERAEPWRLAAAERAGDAAAGPALDAVLGTGIRACRTLAGQLAPFVPDLASRIAAACDDSSGRLPEPRPLFPRIG
jgi:methionyl-tRNA synthetase